MKHKATWVGVGLQTAKLPVRNVRTKTLGQASTRRQEQEHQQERGQDELNAQLCSIFIISICEVEYSSFHMTSDGLLTRLSADGPS
jgi:hypothetical protein